MVARSNSIGEIGGNGWSAPGAVGLHAGLTLSRRSSKPTPHAETLLAQPYGPLSTMELLPVPARSQE
jgi:hypothetical protein